MYLPVYPVLTPIRGYALLLDAAHWNRHEAAACAARIDAELDANPQYQYARKIGQLDEVKAIRIHSPWQHYLDYMRDMGRSVGDIKPTALAQNPKLLDYFMQKGWVL